MCGANSKEAVVCVLKDVFVVCNHKNLTIFMTLMLGVMQL